MIDSLSAISSSINLSALAALILALPTGLAIAFFITRRGYANYDNEIGGEHYKPKHFFKELFRRYPTEEYGLGYKHESGDKESS